MLLARDIGSMINKNKFNSITLRLILSVVIIFTLMIVLSNFLITRKQILIMEGVLTEFSKNYPGDNSSVLLMVDSAQVSSTSEFKIYLLFLMGLILLFGSLIFAYIIKKTLQPLKGLEEAIMKVNIDDPNSFDKSFIRDSDPNEIRELTDRFDKLLLRIYTDYKYQKDFSSNVAHELRTPLAIMQAELDVFKEKITDPMVMDFALNMDKNIKRLKSMVNSVLLLSKKSTPRIKEVDLDDILEELLFDLEDRAIDKNVSINYEKSDIKLMTDDSLIQRLLYNIIENAIKYNEENGSIDIKTREDKNNISIDIIDTGIGISDDKKRMIFDLFYQVDDSRGSEGFGIGLSLSRQIANTLKAKIEIRDNIPKGSIFSIKFKKI